MATDIDELSYSQLSEPSITTVINGHGMDDATSVIIPSSISVANAVSKIDANVAAQNAHNHYTVVKKVRNAMPTNAMGQHAENGNTMMTMTTMAMAGATATPPMLNTSTTTSGPTTVTPVPINGVSNAHTNNHHHNHNNHHLHNHQSNYSG